jgi:glutamine synthetase
MTLSQNVMSAVEAYLMNARPHPAPFEYIWLDASGDPRSKVRFMALSDPNAIFNETWNYDGSSTGQAVTEASEVLLKPVRIYKDGAVPYTYVLCEAILPDGTPARGNTRALFPAEAAESADTWFGFEQEFFIEPIRDPPSADIMNATPQGPFYCAVGGKMRQLTEEIVAKARAIGLGITGWNLEVAPTQTEIQVFGPALRACDDLVMLRYLSHRLLADHGCRPNYAPKPYSALNGSGLHTNVSTATTRNTRDNNGLQEIHRLMTQFANHHDDHITAYGAGNEARLTGTHETSSIREFSYSVGGRHTSVRIPRTTEAAGGGYFEDRRPSAAADPYEIGTAILHTIA